MTVLYARLRAALRREPVRAYVYALVAALVAALGLADADRWLAVLALLLAPPVVEATRARVTPTPRRRRRQAGKGKRSTRDAPTSSATRA